jgi:hypothetical protein
MVRLVSSYQHHFCYLQPRALGRKVSDEFAGLSNTKGNLTEANNS